MLPYVQRQPGVTVIQIPDEQAAALREKAAALGLTLEDWLRSLAAPVGRVSYSLNELLAECDPQAAFSAEDQDWLKDSPVGRENL